MTKLDWRTVNGINLGKVVENIRKLYEENTSIDHFQPENEEERSLNKSEVSIYTDTDRYEVASDTSGYYWIIQYRNDETNYRVITCSSNKFLGRIYEIDKIVRNNEPVY